MIKQGYTVLPHGGIQFDQPIESMSMDFKDGEPVRLLVATCEGVTAIPMQDVQNVPTITSRRLIA